MPAGGYEKSVIYELRSRQLVSDKLRGEPALQTVADNWFESKNGASRYSSLI